MTAIIAKRTAKSGRTTAKITTAFRNVFHRTRGVTQLNQLATQFEASQPNLAAELRFIASRG